MGPHHSFPEGPRHSEGSNTNMSVWDMYIFVYLFIYVYIFTVYMYIFICIYIYVCVLIYICIYNMCNYISI